MQIESFSTLPLQQVINSYLYIQYNDDPALQAFVDAYNSIAEGFFDWFKATPLSVYTLPAINGPLLDWVALGLYGIARPLISTFATVSGGPFDSNTFSSFAFDSRKIVSPGTAQLANDDIYKRVMTWILYLGDGKQTTIDWLKKRIARFLFGPGGTDISLDLIQQISISVTQTASPTYLITIPNSQISQLMNIFLEQGILPMPQQIAYTITIGTLVTIDGQQATINGNAATL
jgi:hypothetical protein